MLFLMEHGTVAAKATEVHTASSHVLLLLFSQSKMKFVEVTCKQQIISARMSPRPPETWLLTSHLFLTLQAVTPSSPVVSLPPTRSPGQGWAGPACVAAGSSPPAPAVPTRPPHSSSPALACLLHTAVLPRCACSHPPSRCLRQALVYGQGSPSLRDHPPSPGSKPPWRGCAAYRGSDMVYSLWFSKLCFLFIFLSLFL